MAQKHKTVVTELLSMKTVQIQLFFNYPSRSYDRVLMILNNVISWFVTSLSAFLTVFPWKNASKLTPLRISNVTSVHGLERFLRSLWPHQPDKVLSPFNFSYVLEKRWTFYHRLNNRLSFVECYMPLLRIEYSRISANCLRSLGSNLGWAYVLEKRMSFNSLRRQSIIVESSWSSL